jgi:hypothetical protein
MKLLLERANTMWQSQASLSFARKSIKVVFKVPDFISPFRLADKGLHIFKLYNLFHVSIANRLAIAIRIK